MSERDLKRIEVLTEILAGRRTVESGAAVMGLAWRQTFRLLARYKELGGASVIHQARGRASNRQMNPGVREYAVELVRTRYADFGPTLAAEVSASRSTASRLAGRRLRRWMVADGLWLSRKQRRTFHQPRLRRESYGELVQIDGSEHRWFEQRGEPCTLLVFIDDATSRLMQLRFVPSESTASYFEALRGYLETHGCPVAFYSDKHSVFRVKPVGGEGRCRHDAVRPSARGTQHRDHLRQLQPGQGPRRTGQPYPAGSACEGASDRERVRYRRRQRLPAGLRQPLQRAVRSAAGEDQRPAPGT